MLVITVPISPEGWDDEKQEFVEPKTQTLQLEHSLVSLSKWESKWKKSFISSKNITNEEMFDYIKCMTLNKNVDPTVYDHLTESNIKAVKSYIEDPMTATTFAKENGGSKNREIITSELIYYWMIASNIPLDPCQKWHLNRLITLIRVCSIKNTPPKKRSKRDIMSQNAALNASRRKQMNTRG
jgi:hypothetical protein